MKVKELIEYLKTLDQEKNIWVCYDGFRLFPPIPDSQTDEWDEKEFKDEGCKLGDYKIIAG